MSHTDISAIVINWNTKDLLLQCVSALVRQVQQTAMEIIVVDNGSSDGSVESVRKTFPQVRCIENPINRGFGAANNQAFGIMQGRYALLINTDAIVLPGAVEQLFSFLESRPDVGMACGQLLNPNGTRQNAFASFPSLLNLTINESLLKWIWPDRCPGKHKKYAHPAPVDSCIGACMIVRTTALEQVSGFDERYFFFFEETDLAKQFWQKGWKVYFVPQAHIVHAQGQTAGAGVYARKLFYYSRNQYLKKWHPRQFPLMMAVIAVRVAANTLINAIGTALTLGLHAGVRMKFMRYARLAGWLACGCRFPKRD